MNFWLWMRETSIARSLLQAANLGCGGWTTRVESAVFSPNRGFWAHIPLNLGEGCSFDISRESIHGEC